MNSFRYSLMNTKFPVTYEPDSPKGVILENLPENIPENTSAICVYNNPRGKPKLDPFVYGLKLKEKCGKDIVVNIRVQDYSIPLFQSVLWGGHVLGIRNLLMVTGDCCSGSPFLIDVTEGITAVTKYFNNGYIMPGLSGKTKMHHNRYKENIDLIDNQQQIFEKSEGKTDFFVGAALIPTRRKEPEIYQQKVDAGAQFFMTQLTYDSKSIIDFMEKVNPSKPVLVGSCPIASLKRIKFFREQLKIPGLSDKLTKSLKAAKNIGEKSVEVCVSMYQELRDFARENNYSLGAHVMAISHPDLALEIIRRLQ